MIGILKASDVLGCCTPAATAKQSVPVAITRRVPVSTPCNFPSPLVLNSPTPIFCGEAMYRPNCVEAPPNMNGNSPCAPHVSCSLILVKPWPTFRGEAMCRPPVPCRGDVSSSTHVQSVNVNNAPEPPSSQPVGRAIPATGQVPGATIGVSIHGNMATYILIGGAVLVGLYFLGAMK